MTKAIRWIVMDEDRLLDRIDRRKAVENIRRGSTPANKGRITAGIRVRPHVISVRAA